MAQGESAPGRVFSVELGGRGGGGYHYNPSIYAGPYRQALEREQLDYERAKEERRQQYEELAQRRAEREDREQEREFKKRDDIESAIDTIHTKIGKTDSMHFQDDYEKIMGDPLVRRAMSSREGMAVVGGVLSQKLEEHNNWKQGWEDTANHYNASFNDLHFNKKGEVDWDRSIPHLTNIMNQKRMQQLGALAEAAQLAEAQGQVATKIDPKTGLPSAFGFAPKGAKVPKVKKGELSPAMQAIARQYQQIPKAMEEPTDDGVAMDKPTPQPDQETAMKYLKAAGGDPDKARQMWQSGVEL